MNTLINFFFVSLIISSLKKTVPARLDFDSYQNLLPEVMFTCKHFGGALATWQFLSLEKPLMIKSQNIL